MRFSLNKTAKDAEQKPVRVILAGNPNVGKSTLFNTVTGMQRHTGNWAGKTVDTAEGRCKYNGKRYAFFDIPGTYSLFPRSEEETVARDFIAFGDSDVTVIVADATRFRANVNLLLQVIEATDDCILCLNFLQDAKREGAELDLPKIESTLGIPVVSADARKKRGVSALFDAIDGEAYKKTTEKYKVAYSERTESLISYVSERLAAVQTGRLTKRFIALRIIEDDADFIAKAGEKFGISEELSALREEIFAMLGEGQDTEELRETVALSVSSAADEFFCSVCKKTGTEYSAKDRRADKILTGKLTAYPIMAALLMLVLWITVFLANYPSGWLASLFDTVIYGVSAFLLQIGTVEWLRSLIIDGILGTLASVVSVMLPPMAIFFPLFTILEDSGYLPRIAYNLDRPLCCAGACGKQALTMCMGLGCNAVGVMGCRIIDSPRERLAAIITNSFMPCNGRFPTIILLSGIFFASGAGGVWGGAVTALALTAAVVIGVLITLFVTRVLTLTLLRGEQSFFTIEMPPYRRPDFLRVITRSLLDRTLYVLGRAAAVAIPAGFVIWLLANIYAGESSILSYVTDFLDPCGRFLGMDGTVLAAFILGIPANEIVIPIALMAYAAEGSLAELSLTATRELLLANGWTVWTAVSVMLFSLCHFPCSTTLITIKKESGSLLWTALAFLIPTAVGVVLCSLLNFAVGLFT